MNIKDMKELKKQRRALIKELKIIRQKIFDRNLPSFTYNRLDEKEERLMANIRAINSTINQQSLSLNDHFYKGPQGYTGRNTDEIANANHRFTKNQ